MTADLDLILDLLHGDIIRYICGFCRVGTLFCWRATSTHYLAIITDYCINHIQFYDRFALQMLEKYPFLKRVHFEHYVPTHKDFCSLTQVKEVCVDQCHLLRVYDVIHNLRHLKKLRVPFPAQQTFPNLISAYIDLPDCLPVNFAGCPVLTTLFLRNADVCEDLVVPSCLEHITLQACAVNDDGLVKLAAHAKILRLIQCEKITNAGVAHFDKLERLEINTCPNLTDAALVPLRSLHTLMLQGSFSGKTLCLLPALRALRVDVPDMDGRLLSALSNLTRLHVRCKTSLDYQRLPNLTQLQASLNSICVGSLLKKIHLFECDIEDAGVAGLQSCSDVILINCRRLTNGAIEHLADCLDLTIAGCKGIDVQALRPLKAAVYIAFLDNALTPSKLDLSPLINLRWLHLTYVTLQQLCLSSSVEECVFADCAVPVDSLLCASSLRRIIFYATVFDLPSKLETGYHLYTECDTDGSRIRGIRYTTYSGSMHFAYRRVAK